jgi:hypothetical protein
MGGNRHDVTQLIPLLDRVPPVRGKVVRRYYNLERLLGAAIRDGAEVGLCGNLYGRPRDPRRATRRGRPPLTTRGADRLDDLGRQGDQLLMAAKRAEEVTNSDVLA